MAVDAQLRAALKDILEDTQKRRQKVSVSSGGRMVSEGRGQRRVISGDRAAASETNDVQVSRGP